MSHLDTARALAIRVREARADRTVAHERVTRLTGNAAPDSPNHAEYMAACAEARALDTALFDLYSVFFDVAEIALGFRRDPNDNGGTPP